MLCIVQARLSSARLPGKVLLPILGKPMIRYLIERLECCEGLDEIIVATPEKDAEEIALALTQLKCEVVGCPGDEMNVARRFRYVLTRKGYKTPPAFIRLCADSPLIDPTLVDWMIEQYDGTWLTNTKPRTFPAGQCVEILNSKGFCRGFPIWRDQPGDDEHVTPPFYRLCNWKNAENPHGDYSHMSMVVDTPEDFGRVSAVFAKMDRPHVLYGWREIVELMS